MQVLNPETVINGAQLTLLKLFTWPDGMIGKRWKRSTDQPIFWAGNGKNTAILDVPNRWHYQFTRPAGLPADIVYCSGGPIITNPIDGSWIMIVHTERWPNGNNHAFWLTIALLKSADQGHSWQFLGEIITPYKPFALDNSQPCEITGGAYTFSPNFTAIYIYFRECMDDYTGRAAMAYCDFAQFCQETADWRTPTFAKHGDNGDNLAAQLPGLPAETDWNDVIYLADKRQYLMAYCPFRDKRIYLAISLDGICWNSLGTQSVVTEPGACYYPNFVSMYADERFGLLSQGVYLYYLLAHNSLVWPNMEWKRRQVYST